ncbi:MAG: hypothetical protein ACOZIN_08530 [Myxococcota bacterium]
MPAPLLIAGAGMGAAAVASAAAALVSKRRKAKQSPLRESLPGRETAQAGRPSPAPRSDAAPGLKLPTGAIAGAGGAAATVGAGLLLNAGLGKLTELSGGTEGRSNYVAATGIPGFVGVQTAQGISTGLRAVGVDANAAESLGRWGGAAAAVGLVTGGFGLPAVAGAAALYEGTKAIVGAVGGEQAAKDFANAVASLDPTSSKTIPGQVVGAVGGFIKNLWPF